MEINKIPITEYLSYIPASENPLSADVILIEGEEYLYVYDVGNNEQVAEYLNTIPQKKKIVLSHFHPDHVGNIGRVFFEAVYAGTAMEKYYSSYVKDYKEKANETYVKVTQPVEIADGVELCIYPVPSSHAKGSLLLQVNGEYILLGDALYPQIKAEKQRYNVQLLKEEMELLENLSGDKLFLSHETRPVKSKKSMIKYLSMVYEKRKKDNPYIEV